MPTVDTITISPYTALYTALVSEANMTAGVSTLEGRTENVIDFNLGEGLYARDFETAYSWPIAPGIVLYSWQPTLIEQPENTYNRATDWIECGGGTGFVQGIIIEADTFGATKVFQLQDSDTLQFHALNEVGLGASFGTQQVRAFSCAFPFIAHSVRVTTSDGVPWRVWRTDLVFVPFPEETELWKTELTAAGGIGWQHIRDINVEYWSESDITVTFAVDTGNGSYGPDAIILPSSGGTQAKLRMNVSRNKWKLIGVSAFSLNPFYLFVEGMEMTVRSWGESSPYRRVKPFGGKSAMKAVV